MRTRIAGFTGVLLVILLAGTLLAGNNIVIEWDSEIGSEGAQLGYDVIPAYGGGYLAAGITYPAGDAGNAYLVKTNAVGLVEWQREFSLSPYAEGAYSVVATQDGNYLLIGSAYRAGSYEFRPWLVKIDRAGNPLWSTENGLTEDVAVDSAIIRGLERPDGTIVIAGGTNSFSNYQDPWVATVDATGNLLNFTAYPPFQPGYGQGVYLEAIAPTADGGFVLAGTANSLIGEAFLWKFDAGAQEEWVQFYGDQALRIANSVVQAQDGSYLLVGCSLANCNDTVVVRADATGDALWATQYPVDGYYSRGTGIIKGADGAIYAGSVRGTAVNSDDYVDILEIDPDGNLLNSVTLPGSAMGTTITELRAVDGGLGFITTGYVRNTTANGGTNLYLAKGVFGDGVGNQPPTGEPDAYQTNEDEPLAVATPGVLANDSDPENDPLGAWLTTAPNAGTLSLAANGSFIYTPTVGFTGLDEFVYRAFDGQATSLDTSVLITVTEALNHAPEAVNDAYQIGHNTVLSVAVPGLLANDVDPDGDPLLAALVDPPANGTVTLAPSGSFVYTPTTGFAGADAFSYVANDGIVAGNVATATISVGPPAGFSFDWFTALGGDSFDYANDISPTSDGGFVAVGVGAEGNYESVFVVKVDAQGDESWSQVFGLGNYAERGFYIEETNDGGLIVFATAYLPAAFEFRPWLMRLDADGNLIWSTEDGLTQDLAVGSGIVHGVERADGGFYLAGGTNSLTDYQEAWVAAVSPAGELESFTSYPPFQPGYGQGTYVLSLTPTADGGFALAGTANSYVGEAFLWKFDDNGQEEWVQFYGSAGMRLAESVRLAADGGYYLVGCEQPNCSETVLLRTDGAGDLLWSQNYADPDGHYTLGRDLLEKADGSLLLLQTWSSGAGGANQSDLLEINPDGSLRTTTPIPGGEGATNLRRLIPSGDGAGFVAAGSRSGPAGSSSMDLYLLRGTFVDVPGEVNHAPQAMPDSFTLEAGQVLTHDHADGVLANDHDPDGQILTAHLVADVDHGSLTLAEDGGFSYVPAPDFDGTVSFSYRASDGELYSAETAVQITVLPAQAEENEPPVAQPDAYNVPAGTTLLVAADEGLLANDQDPDGHPLSVVVVQDVAHGTLLVTVDGSFEYVPSGGFHGVDEFKYYATDGELHSAVMTVRITVDPAIEQPAIELFIPLITANKP